MKTYAERAMMETTGTLDTAGPNEYVRAADVQAHKTRCQHIIDEYNAAPCDDSVPLQDKYDAACATLGLLINELNGL